ncbi:MAG TPA: hypothetical protein VHV51_05260 [Polyangiaceae bacterium]|nr:hypothetical protein [Polyangiaceae bacterium]
MATRFEGACLGCSLLALMAGLGCSSSPANNTSSEGGTAGASLANGGSMSEAGNTSAGSGGFSYGGSASAGTSAGGSVSIGNGGSVATGGFNAGGSAGSNSGGASGSNSGGSSGSAGSGGGTSSTSAKQSWIWVWENYSSAMKAVAANAKSFTHVSPALYQLNYNYSSGVSTLVNANDDFGGGLSSKSIATASHDAGLKCVPLMYAGAGNSGTDQGIQNVLNDAPSGAQGSFISSMVTEAKNKGYDGYNLDWEVGNTGSDYSNKLVSFLSAFKSALNQQGMILTIDIAGWYVSQCSASGGSALVDLTKLGPSVDQAIIEDYAGSLGSVQTCASANANNSKDCGDSNFATGLNVMCDMPANVVNIGLIYSANNGGADSYTSAALDAVTAYGYKFIAVWPDDYGFFSQQSWYSALAKFLGN